MADVGGLDLEKARRAVVAASNAAENPFSLLTFDQLWIDAREDVSWVCPELGIGPGRPCGLWGFGGCGKTYVAIALAIATVSGRLLFGRYHVVRGPVVYLSHEMGRLACVERARRLANGMLCEPIDLVGMDVGVYPKVKLNSPGAREAYLKLCAGKRLCVIDSLRRALPGEDENDSAIGQYLDLLAEVSDLTGCTFLVLHHSPKASLQEGGKQIDLRAMGRGSGSIFDGSGAVWFMEGSGAYPRKLTQIRANDNSDANGDEIRIELVQPSIPEEVVSFDTHGPAVRYDVLGDPPKKPATQDQEAVFARIKEATLAQVQKQPGSTGRGIEERVPGRVTSVRQALDELEDEGRIESRPGPRKSFQYYPKDVP